MRIWRFWLNALIWSSQYNPAEFIETIMLFLAMGLIIIWALIPHWSYLVLSLSYGIGALLSISIRKSLAHSPQAPVAQLITVLWILASIYILFVNPIFINL